MININVGDYVETIDGMTGYVTRVELGNVYNTITVKINTDNYCWSVFNCQEYDYEKHFKRIGSHDFTIKENKIKPLNNMNFVVGNRETLDYKMNQGNIFDMWDKINEIIDYINKEE